MIIRSAVLEGTVAEADREAFDRQMETAVLPAIATYPGIVEVRLRRPVEAETGAPPVYMVFDLYFETLDAMQAALASPVRGLVREADREGDGGLHGQGLSPRPGGRSRPALRTLTTLITGAGARRLSHRRAAGGAG